MNPEFDHNVNGFQRLVWSCRRGMLELDILLSNFLHEAFLSLNDEQKQDFIALLQYPDPTLFSFLMGDALSGVKAHDAMILLVREHARQRLSST